MLLLQPDVKYFHADLREAGASQRWITRWVREGVILRPRQGTYLAPESTSVGALAAAVGGRVACTTALAEYGIFVLERDAVHLQVAPHATGVVQPPGSRLHWSPCRRQPPLRSLRVEPFDALLQAVQCQSPRAAIATLDSALFLGVIDEDDLDELFTHLPRRYRALRPLVDGRAESGPETYVRLLLRALGVATRDVVCVAGR